MTRKVEACLENIALGLIANPGLSIEPLLMLIHGVISLSVPELRLPAPRIQEDSNLTVSGKPMKTDSLIIAPVPKRKVAAAAQPSVSGLSRSAYVINSHYVVEFGLLVLSHLLKREKCHEGDANPKVLPMLDPMVSIVYENLNNPHSKVNERFSFLIFKTLLFSNQNQLVALSLRCICTLLRVPLPSLDGYAPKISSAVFSILHKYSGSTSGENLEMVQTAFKVG